MQKTELKIYLHTIDKYNSNPLWEQILDTMQKEGFLGATVYKAVAGFGKHKEIHTFEILNLSQNIPIVIETVEEKERVLKYIKKYKTMLQNCYITLKEVDVIDMKEFE